MQWLGGFVVYQKTKTKTNKNKQTTNNKEMK